ncbi:family 114 glycoside hydrolase, partial [Gaertneriomyces semiglobifer]
ICYFSAGSYENWRPDRDDFKSDMYGKAMEGWEGEYWLDIRKQTVKDVMIKRLDMAQQKGCDGVEPDNVDGYINDTGLPLTATEQLSYNRFLAQEAHTRGLSIGLKNDLDQLAELVADFDWLLNEECVEFNECQKLTTFINADKAVFGV